MATRKQASRRAGDAFRGGPGGRSPPPREDATRATICNRRLRNLATCNPVNHYRLVCTRPDYPRPALEPPALPRGPS
eukprot:9866941-Alexandrium_andersonii.AAC.1